MNKLIKLSKYISSIINIKNIGERIKKTSNKDAIIFNLLYTKKNSTYEIAAANLNNFNVIINKNKNTVSRQALENRNNNISNDQYKNIYDNISKYINIHFYKEKYKYQIFAVDGSNINLKKSFSNNGYKLNKNKQSVTALNLGIYNITRNYPIILELVNHKNERRSFIDFINKTETFKDDIFIFDRGFYSNELIKQLETKKLRYICRIKKSSLLLNSHDTDYIIMHNNSNIRIIKYYIDGNLYYLATNLYDQDEFNIDKLKILYHDRWQVEELFKYIKKYFTFESMQITSIKNINKIIYSELIICRIAELLIKQQKKDGDKIVNKNTLIEGLYDNLLFLICNGKLNYNNIKHFYNIYIKFIISKKNRSYIHIALRPNYKWYQKGCITLSLNRIQIDNSNIVLNG